LSPNRSSFLWLKTKFSSVLQPPECLRNAGFVVIEAASAKEAQIALDVAPNIDAVLSDINMPDPNFWCGYRRSFPMCLSFSLPLTPIRCKR
jgi:hypothetical protein